MTPERWQQVRELFDAALERPVAERREYVRSSAGLDADLAEEVESLLATVEEEGSVLDQPAARSLPEIDPADRHPRQVGPYQIQRFLGGGGMGTVYAATRADQPYQKLVAVKVIRHAAEHPALLQRFLHERQLLAALDHPNIARLIDGGALPDGSPYLVMEYVEGLPIDRHCDVHKLNLPERIRLFLTVCDAVHYAHQNLIVHRDLKPSNILVTPQGTVKLLDFGIAKLLRPELRHGPLDLTMSELGPMTPEYASPEQIRGDPVTTAVDVYVLGILLFRLLAGRPPYHLSGYAPEELVRVIGTAEPPKPSSLSAKAEEVTRPDGTVRKFDPQLISAARSTTPERLRRALAGDLDVIILHALRKEPGRRYASAERLADDLRRHLNKLPVAARGDSWLYQFGRFLLRYRTASVATTVAAAALVFTTWTARKEQALAEQRFQDLREFTNLVLFDFDERLRHSPTEGRKALIEKALGTLEKLSLSAVGDRSLRTDLIRAWLKLGDMQGNLYGANVGDRAGALSSYEKARRLGESVAQEDSSPEITLQLSETWAKFGELAGLSEDRGEALRHYQKAIRLIEPMGEEHRRSRLPGLWRRIGHLQYQLGDTAAAAGSVRKSLETAEQWRSREPKSMDAQVAVALAEERLGELLAVGGEKDEGLRRLQLAMATYTRLLREYPGNPELRHDFISGSMIMGDTLAEAGRIEEALVRYREAMPFMEGLARDDPGNRQYGRDLARLYTGLSEHLARLKDRDGARAAAAKALIVLQPLVDRSDPSDYDLQQYVWLLTRIPLAELRNPGKALPYARKAVEITRGSDPRVLLSLFWAAQLAGDRDTAQDALERAARLASADGLGKEIDEARREIQAKTKR